VHTIHTSEDMHNKCVPSGQLHRWCARATSHFLTGLSRITTNRQFAYGIKGWRRQRPPGCILDLKISFEICHRVNIIVVFFYKRCIWQISSCESPGCILDLKISFEICHRVNIIVVFFYKRCIWQISSCELELPLESLRFS
jgi:hypothetical protein